MLTLVGRSFPAVNWRSIFDDDSLTDPASASCSCSRGRLWLFSACDHGRVPRLRPPWVPCQGLFVGNYCARVSHWCLPASGRALASSPSPFALRASGLPLRQETNGIASCRPAPPPPWTTRSNLGVCHSDPPSSLGRSFAQPGRYAPAPIQSFVRRSSVAYLLAKLWTVPGAPSCPPDAQTQR
jgi:hypothetical protein